MTFLKPFTTYPRAQPLLTGIYSTSKKPSERHLIITLPESQSWTCWPSYKLTIFSTPSQPPLRKTFPIRTHPPKTSLLTWNMRKHLLYQNTLISLTLTRMDFLPWDLPMHLTRPNSSPTPLTTTYFSDLHLQDTPPPPPLKYQSKQWHPP